LDTISSSASLSIRQIRDVNLSWVREDLGDLTALRNSIDKHGLQLPILMSTTMYVADGARRLEACAQLGYKSVPVVVTSDWELVVAYYQRARELVREGWPSLAMPWKDLADLLNGPMKDLYSERYRVLRQEVVVYNDRMRKTGGKPIKEKKHLYVTAASACLGFKDSDLRTIREVYTTMRKLNAPALKDEAPDATARRHTWAKVLDEQLRECEESGGERLYAVLARVRMASRGEDPTTIKAIRGRRTFGDPTYEERKAAASQATPTGREIDAAVMNNIETLLRQVADTVHFYTHVRPSVRMSDATDIADSMKRSIGKLNGLIRVLRAYGSNNPNLEERSTA